MSSLRTQAVLAQRKAAYAALEARHASFRYQASLTHDPYPLYHPQNREPFGADALMRTYTDYSNSVVRLMARHATLAAGQRASAIQAAKGSTQIGLDITAAVGPLASALPSPDPIADILSPPVVQSVTAAFSPVVAAATDGAAGTIAQATGLPTTAVQEGINAAKTAITGAALEASRAAQPPAAVPAFDAGVALAAGAAKFGVNIPKGLTPGEKASWLVTHGVNGATAEVKTAVLKTVAAHPEMIKGAKLAVSGIQRGIHPSLLVNEAVNGLVATTVGIAAILGGIVGGLIAGPWGAAIGATAAGGGAGFVTTTDAFAQRMEKAKAAPEVQAAAIAESAKSAALEPVEGAASAAPKKHGGHKHAAKAAVAS